jgi:proteasome lid subunit RPN8/RPN11
MLLTAKLFAEMSAHACEAVENEVCGLIYNSTYVRLRNASSFSAGYSAHPQDLAMALNHFGEPEAIFHTHRSNLELSHLDVAAWYYTVSIMIVGIVLHGQLVIRGYRNHAGRIVHEPLLIER